MSSQNIQKQKEEAQLQIENAIAAIALEREALKRDPRLNPDLIAHNIERYQEIILNHLTWLNTHGFVASVSDGALSVQQSNIEGGTAIC